MKNIYFLLFFSFTFVLFVGCGKQSDITSPREPDLAGYWELSRFTIQTNAGCRNIACEVQDFQIYPDGRFQFRSSPDKSVQDDEGTWEILEGDIALVTERWKVRYPYNQSENELILRINDRMVFRYVR
ncbi:MAG: hypothetical protein KKA84_06950 [Bacteroidetes bacterium]|nr:hypothetical protein [Bacteroidota bacterium]